MAILALDRKETEELLLDKAALSSNARNPPPTPFSFSRLTRSKVTTTEKGWVGKRLLTHGGVPVTN